MNENIGITFDYSEWVKMVNDPIRGAFVDIPNASTEYITNDIRIKDFGKYMVMTSGFDNGNPIESRTLRTETLDDLTKFAWLYKVTKEGNTYLIRGSMKK